MINLRASATIIGLRDPRALSVRFYTKAPERSRVGTSASATITGSGYYARAYCQNGKALSLGAWTHFHRANLSTLNSALPPCDRVNHETGSHAPVVRPSRRPSR